MLSLELLTAASWGIFLIRTSGVTQLLFTLSFFSLSIAWMFLCGSLLRKQSSQQRLYKIAVLLTAPLYLVLSTKIALPVEDFLFARSLPRYQSVVERIKNGSIKIRDRRVQLPSQERDLAYVARAAKTNGTWTITFLVGGGFPVKHKAYVYKSDDKWTNADWRNWSSYKRRAPYWFEASD